MSDIIIDSRSNPSGKNLGNRQRFIRRVRKQAKEAADKAIRERTIDNAAKGQGIKVPLDNTTKEPVFRHDPQTGIKRRVLPGNRQFTQGDVIPHPSGSGGRGTEGSPDGEGVDPFEFTLTRDEFLNIFFDDLELPNLVKKSLKGSQVTTLQRAGISRSGSDSSIDFERTMTNSIGRRHALKRPSRKEMKALEAQIIEMESRADLSPDEQLQLIQLREQYKRFTRRRKIIPYIDPDMDLRYKRFEQKPKPATQAVMICLMDVSASMGEREKDLAKRFFLLLYLFLTRTYKDITVIFIRHTQVAQEVDEHTFFCGTETGGTVVSSALEEALRIITDRYGSSDWNVYIAQASDGDNFGDQDNVHCAELLQTELMPLVQYYAYVEITRGESQDSRRSSLWETYKEVARNWPNFAIQAVGTPGEIYPVFRDMFKKQNTKTERMAA